MGCCCFAAIFLSPELDVEACLWTSMTHWRLPALLWEKDDKVLFILHVGIQMKASQYIACIAFAPFSQVYNTWKFDQNIRWEKALCYSVKATHGDGCERPTCPFCVAFKWEFWVSLIPFRKYRRCCKLLDFFFTCKWVLWWNNCEFDATLTTNAR